MRKVLSKRAFKTGLLFLILVLAFLVRLYRIDNPLADWHSWRQTDTSAVSRNFVKDGFSFLYPRFDDLSDVSSGLKNPEGYRFVEYPFYNFFQAGFYRLWPIFNLEIWGRLVSIFFSLGSLFFLYLIGKKYLGEIPAFLASLFFALLPFNIYYSRVVLPEPMMVFTSLAMVYFFSEGIEKESKLNLSLGTIFALVSFLIKPFTAVYLFPIFYLAFKKWRFNYRKWFFFLAFLVFSFLPFFLWRWWINHFPEGIPSSWWLFNDNNIRFKPAFFYWLFAERLGKLILGYWGLILFGLGLIVKISKKEGFFFFWWLAGILAYFVIIAGGNIRHDYYQALAVPLICFFLAKGSYFLLNTPKNMVSQFGARVLLVVSFSFTLAFSWYYVRDYFNINNFKIIEAGKAVDRLLPPEAKVVAPYSGDTAFLYQTNRKGWPIGIQIEKMIDSGVDYYVNINFGPETDWLEAVYCPLEKTPDWVIIDLTKKCELEK